MAAPDWVDRFAAELEDRLGYEDPTLHIASIERDPILDLARDVAHATERKNAPLATFVVGAFVAARVADGTDAADAFAEATEVAHDLL